MGSWSVREEGQDTQCWRCGIGLALTCNERGRKDTESGHGYVVSSQNT